MGLDLDEARAQTGVPRGDLESLEHGALERFHLESAAVIALLHYAQVLTLDPDPLVRVVRQCWPRSPSAPPTPGAAGPASTAQIGVATRLFDQFEEQGLPSEVRGDARRPSVIHDDLSLRDLSAHATLAALVAAHRNVVTGLAESATPPEPTSAPEPASAHETAAPPETAALVALPAPREGASGRGTGGAGRRVAERGHREGADETTELAPGA